MKEEQKTARKVRSDKKHSIAPYVPDTFRVWIHRIARHLEIPEGEVGVLLIESAIMDEECMRFFTPYYKRNYSYNNVLFFGNDFAAPISDYIEIQGKRDRFKVRLSKGSYERVCEFQIALGTPYLAHATHALLRYALHTRGIIGRIAPMLRYEDIFKNAPAPRSHSQIQVTDLAFPKTELKRAASKVDAQSSITIVEPQVIDVSKQKVETKDTRSVWSVLQK
ncbi:hypothetical protein [Paenibacillus sp. Y412MC10]|uniref:hypothetical protein n=1 Tax=Geobacillus sp. (strain Y412MC10) TaxID=481743 RepID=UPI001643569A|nr:hypothetical protein [Paenibacillus sp. Y412MC10]